MEDIIIREACEADAAQLIAYLKTIGGETDNLTFGAEGLPITLEDEIKYIRSILESDNSVMYVAVKNGEIVGDGSLNGMSRRMHHRAELGISVVRAEWNKGIGNQLMSHLIQYAKDSGTKIVHLEVRADNQKAIHLYEKYGFYTIGSFPGFMKIGQEYIDCNVMCLDLRSTRRNDL